MTVVLDDATERILLIWLHRFIMERHRGRGQAVEEGTGYRIRSPSTS